MDIYCGFQETESDGVTAIDTESDGVTAIDTESDGVTAIDTESDGFTAIDTESDGVTAIDNDSMIYYTPAPRRGRGVYCFTSVHPSVRPRNFSPHFLSNC